MKRMEQVKASAGSGKTHDITQRFLAYLAQSEAKSYAPYCGLRGYETSEYDAEQGILHSDGGEWGDIMAITFTNSAAAEMKERVLKELKKCALDTENSNNVMSPAKAKAWIDIILRQYGALNIRTIDSLLHLIVRTAALDLDLPPDFESSFHIQELLDPVFDKLLEQAEHGDEDVLWHLQAMCHSLLFLKDTHGFVIGSRMMEAVKPLVEMLMTRDLSYFENLSSKEEIQERLIFLDQALIQHAQDLLALVQSEALKLDKRAENCFIASAAGAKNTGSAYYTKDSLEDCLVKASKGKASDMALRAFILLKESATLCKTEGHILLKALQMYPFFEVAALMAEQILSFQQQESKVPASKMPLMARDILESYQGVSAALCRLGNNLHHVLLDEFQDTSREQWDALCPLLVMALSQGGTFTWVGDVKQAIYGWRGGDADLFDEVKQVEELTRISDGVELKNLPTNWRSLEHVVKTNNTLFAPLSQEDTARQILEVMLSAHCPSDVLDAATQKLCRAFMGAEQKVKPHAEGGYVCIEEVQGDNAEELDEAVYEALQTKMEELRERRPWGDITILTRSNTGASKVASWLAEWQIPAITENSLLLHMHPLIQESLALLSFLHYPQDDLSFWTVLTGHMMRTALRSEHEENNIRPSIEELHAFALEPRHVSLSFAFQNRWPEFWEYAFTPFYGTAQVLTPYDCMQEWFRVWRIPQRFPQAQVFVRRFLEVIHVAEGQGAGTLGAFLDYWAQNGGDEKTPTPSKLDAVRVMTIHKSKGLQFPVVIVPWLSFNIQDNYPPVVQNVGNLRVLASRSKESESEGFGGGKNLGAAHYTAQADGALESLNVFYVACTRAQEELHMFHTHTPKLLERNNLANGLTELLSIIQKTLPLQEGSPVENQAHKQEQEQALSSWDMEQEASEYICPLDFSQEPQRIMQWLPRLKIYRDPLQEYLLPATATTEAVVLEQDDEKQLSARRRGLLVHHCLEILQTMGQDVFQESREQLEARVHSAATLGVHSFGLPVQHIQRVQEEVVTALLWYATLPGVHEWWQHAISEQEIMAENGAVYRVDLLLPPQGVYGWRVVEFKTGRFEDGHVKQLRNYLRLLDALPSNAQQFSAGLMPSQGVLVYVDLQKCRMVYSSGTGQVSEFLEAPLWQEGQ